MPVYVSDRPVHYLMAAPRPVNSPLGNTKDSVNRKNGPARFFIAHRHQNDVKLRKYKAFDTKTRKGRKQAENA